MDCKVGILLASQSPTSTQDIKRDLAAVPNFSNILRQIQSVLILAAAFDADSNKGQQ